MKPNEELAILNAMRDSAEKLCSSNDGLLKGQFEHLRARIDALIELYCAIPQDGQGK